MPAISYNITVGSTTVSSKDKAVLKELQVNSALKVPVNTAEILLVNYKGAAFKPTDKVAIELGLDGKNSKVFTGVVDSVEHSLNTIRIISFSAIVALTLKQSNEVFENKSTGDICKQLVSGSKLTTGKVDDGVTFPRYVLNGNRNIWQNLDQLASFSGTDLFADKDDKINFVTYKSSGAAIFNDGEQILDLEKELMEPPYDGAEVYGESPAGQGQSDEAVFWFKKEEVVGTAGKTSGTVARYVIASARNKQLCSSIAKNLLNTSSSTANGRALVLNGEKVSLGGTVNFKGVPDKGLDGFYKVVAINHQLNEKYGFTTEIMWEETA